MSVELFHRRTGQGPTVMILHGLFGNSDNFGSIGRDLAVDTDVVLVDQRDHGRSPHTDHVDYAAMASDVHALVERLALKEITLVGHSMGGKTAMLFAQRHPERLKHLVVIDIGPREYASGNHDHIVEALLSSDLANKRSRKEVEAHLARHVKEPGVVQFLLKSLYWAGPDRLAWRFNVPVLARDLPNILAAIGHEKVRVPTLFLRGGQSDYILREDVPAIREQFADSRIETIDYAGHWVHAQAPEEVTRAIRSIAQA